MSPMLTVYTASHCFGCEESKRIAEEMETKFPGIVVEIHNLDDEGVEKPEEVFAVPTYLLDGEILCLGNPKREWLSEQIAQSLAQE